MVWARGARVFACAGLLMALVVSTSLAASKGHKRTEKPDESENSELQDTSSDSIRTNVKRRQATIAAMAVHEMANGKLIGDTLPLVATVSGGARNGKVSIRGHIGEEMKTALDDA